MTLQEVINTLNTHEPRDSTPLEIAFSTLRSKANDLLALRVPPDTEMTPLVAQAVSRWRESRGIPIPTRANNIRGESQGTSKKEDVSPQIGEN